MVVCVDMYIYLKSRCVSASRIRMGSHVGEENTCLSGLDWGFLGNTKYVGKDRTLAIAVYR